MVTRKWLVAVGFVLATLAMAGCGSKSAGNAGDSTASSGASDPVKTKALAMVKQYMTVPDQWPGGGDPYKPGSHKAVVIGCGFTAQACEQPSEWAVDALKDMGWDVPAAEDTKYDPTVTSNLIETAVQQGAEGIIFIGIDVNTVPTATQDAVDAGVKMMCVVCTTEGSKWQGKVVDVTPDWHQAGVLAAWETLAISGSKAHTAQFYDPEFAAIRLRDAGVEDTYKAECPGCKLDTIKINGPDLSQPGPPPWNAYLASHPEGTVNNVIGEWDGGAITVSGTDVSAGRDIPIGSYDGEAPNLGGISTGKPVPITWSIGQPYYYEAWAAADALGRWVNGLTMPTDLQKMPLVIINKDNVSQFLKGNPAPSTYIAPNNDWQAAFKALWQK